MTVAPSRTVVLPKQPLLLFGAPMRRRLRWPVAEPGDVLDYSLDLSAPLAEVNDLLRSADIDVRPSGDGELSILSFSGSGGVLTAWLSGGVLGRPYEARITGQTLAGRSFQVLIVLPIDPSSVLTPPAPPPSYDYGASLIWHAASPFRIDLRRPVSAALLAAVF